MGLPLTHEHCGAVRATAGGLGGPEDGSFSPHLRAGTELPHSNTRPSSKSENGYKKISKQLKKPISTVRAIIKKFKATGDDKNQPGRGRVRTLAHEEDGSTGKRISMDHSWRNADVS